MPDIKPSPHLLMIDLEEWLAVAREVEKEIKKAKLEVAREIRHKWRNRNPIIGIGGWLERYVYDLELE